MNLTLHQNYWDSPEKKQEFKRFLVAIHNLDLGLWDELGYWDNRYRPFSLFDSDRLVAHACLYSMDMIVNGRRCEVAQVSAVGTLPEYRRQGLGYRINQAAIGWARDKHEFFFLFADAEALPLYRKCGFRRVTEHKTRVLVDGKLPQDGAVKLDMNNANDRALAYRLACERTPVSNLLGVFNPKLFMYWCLYWFRDGLYYIRDLDTLVLLERKEGVLSVCDIVGKTMPPFADVYPFISDPGDQAAEFLFMTDRMGLSDANLVEVTGNGTHLMGTFPLDGEPFILPLTAHA